MLNKRVDAGRLVVNDVSCREIRLHLHNKAVQPVLLHWAQALSVIKGEPGDLLSRRDCSTVLLHLLDGSSQGRFDPK